jgi:hypothetical protein
MVARLAGRRRQIAHGAAYSQPAQADPPQSRLQPASAGRSPTEPPTGQLGDGISRPDAWQFLSTDGGRRQPRYMLALHTWRSGTSQDCFSAVHSDTPAAPHVVHIAVHKHVLTILETRPNFARQESPGSRPHVASGEGRRTACSGASGCSPCRSGARGPRCCAGADPWECARSSRPPARCDLLANITCPGMPASSQCSSSAAHASAVTKPGRSACGRRRWHTSR